MNLAAMVDIPVSNPPQYPKIVHVYKDSSIPKPLPSVGGVEVTQISKQPNYMIGKDSFMQNMSYPKHVTTDVVLSLLL